ncbi:MAG: HlyD family efflux transporter periplasmic adaptor subunit [Flavobacteriales bacterium]|nr:HlyD family efflux transporter periplasmic adaptor subunit [Flavobacteriales bacterium]
MLNISNNKVDQRIQGSKFKVLRELESFRPGNGPRNVLLILLAVFVVAMFLPWTQNVRATGKVTSLRPDQRPQTVNSVIAGRIEKWFVQEGQKVQKGDTLMFISEVKSEYFDPNLLDRTEQQLKAKELSVVSYMDKVKALDSQIDALVQTNRLKLSQAENYLRQANLKVQSDSIEFNAAELNVDIANRQLDRTEQLFESGLKSRTELENARLKAQEALAKSISAENKWLASQNDAINAKIQLTTIEAEFKDKISKAESEKYSALSGMYDAEAVVTKIQNEFTNYSARTGFYYITAPQTGFVTRALKYGVGETLKEGEEILTIVPEEIDRAVEIYVEPMDLPLLAPGREARLLFDGWPAIIFSGWPNTSYGTFGGEVVAIDQTISDNGKFRVLIAPDTAANAWPTEVKVGSGASGLLLLNDVPIWYELWRRVNGFPPDFYQNQTSHAVLQSKTY